MLVKKTIAFFSTKNELELLKKRGDFTKIKLVALTPEADFALDEFPERKNNIEDYYSEKELNIIGNNSLNKIKEICSTINLEYFKSEELFSCLDLYMFIKFLYDQLLINHTFCQAIFKKELPNKIIIFNLPELSETILTDNNDDLMLHCIHYFFSTKNGLKAEIITYSKTPYKTTKFSVNNILSRVIFPLKKLKLDFINILFRFFNFKKPAIYILQHYDFETCLNLRKMFKTYWRNVCHKTLHTRRPQNKLPYSQKLDTLFKFDNVCYYELINTKINFIVEPLAKDFKRLVKKFIATYIKKNVKLVISAAGQTIEILAGTKAANICKIPLIWGQHGGFYGYANFPIQQYLIRYYSHYFLYTDEISIAKGNVPHHTIPNSKLLRLYKINRSNES